MQHLSGDRARRRNARYGPGDTAHRRRESRPDRLRRQPAGRQAPPGHGRPRDFHEPGGHGPGEGAFGEAPRRTAEGEKMRNVLIVEDSKAIRSMIRMALE